MEIVKIETAQMLAGSLQNTSTNLAPGSGLDIDDEDVGSGFIGR